MQRLWLGWSARCHGCRNVTHTLRRFSSSSTGSEHDDFWKAAETQAKTTPAYQQATQASGDTPSLSVDGDQWAVPGGFGPGQMPMGEAYGPSSTSGDGNKSALHPSPPSSSTPHPRPGYQKDHVFDMLDSMHLSPTKQAEVFTFRGMTLVDIRQHYKGANGEILPSKKGISLTIPQWRRLQEAIGDIENKIHQREREGGLGKTRKRGMSIIENYREWANGIGDYVLDWARNGQTSDATEGWFLTEFATALAIVGAYLAMVAIGPKIMSGMDPIDSYPVRFVYNVVQIILCSYMCVEAFMIASRNGYPVLPCAPFDAKNPPSANLLWLFYISKVLDFMDTIFIVMKKSWRQLSFLHVYHHTTIFLFYWLNVNAGYDGDVYLTIVLNGFIHTVMYTYYFVSMHTKDIWWKKYLTLMQMIQFVCMTTQAMYLLTTGCTSYPPRIVIVYAGYILSLLFLFAKFYVNSYSKPSKKNA
eukprot:g6109.t1